MDDVLAGFPDYYEAFFAGIPKKLYPDLGLNKCGGACFCRGFYIILPARGFCCKCPRMLQSIF